VAIRETAMKLVMLLVVRDDADVVDAQIAFHLNAGVDFVIATDHESVDGTSDLLEGYSRAGYVRLMREHGEARDDVWRMNMARLAIREHAADWIIDSHADEFWLPRAESIREVLAAIPSRYGAVQALTRVSLEIRRGETVAIIGPNGAGKTTLLNVISGFYHASSGRILYEGQDRTHLRPYDVAALGIARTFQNVALFKGMSVLDNIMTGRLLKMPGNILLDAIYWGPAKKQELEHRAVVERIIAFLEIEAIRKTPAGRLPYGLQKRVELARALAAEPTLLLLDEPMAGMNVEEKEDMCRFILDVRDEFGTTIALIEHDMSVVMDISDRVVALDYGRKIADGTPDEVRADRAVLDAYLGVAHA
jgi:branched-chain amino acid transport system ATP-binding protein